MVEQPVQAGAEPTRFRNVRFSLIAAALAASCLLIVVFRRGVVEGAAIALALYCLQAAWAMLLGVTLRDGTIAFPRSPLRVLPFLVLGRMARPVAALDEITHMGHAFGSEWVMAHFDDERRVLPFASRDQRLAFFSAIRSVKPDVRIYRQVT